jgi:hypothetical protein
MDEMIQYDVVKLPSQGMFYPDKKKELKVAYLNATDENILAAPNLITNNQIVDELLKRKILDKDFDLSLMPEEDKQAVLIFLRNTAFGTTYKVKIVDESLSEKKEYEIDIDLSEVKVKDFDLIVDGNDEFETVLPMSKAVIKFVFLSPKVEDELRKFEKEYKGPDPVVPIVTKTLEKTIREVNGNRDMMAIHRFIQFMPIADSQYLRKFIKEKRPGLDLTYPVQLPTGRVVDVAVTFGMEFFRPFYGL